MSIHFRKLNIAPGYTSYRVLANIFLLYFIAFSLSSQTKDEKYFKINKNLSVFNSILRELDAYYVDTLDYDKVVLTGINSMLSSLDPYTVYMPEEMNDDRKMISTGEYSGS